MEYIIIILFQFAKYIYIIRLRDVYLCKNEILKWKTAIIA